MQPTRREFLSVTLAYLTSSKLKLQHSLAETRIADPLKPHDSVVVFANSLKDKPLSEAINYLHNEYRAGGNLKISKKSSSGTPLDAEETFSAKCGNCSELGYLMISGFVALGLNSRADVKIGALECHVKGKPDDEWHLVPVILMRELQVNLRFQLFETDEKFRERTTRLAGIIGDWHMLIVDPQAKTVGTLSEEIEKTRYAPFNGSRAFYFRQYGLFELKKNNFRAAQKRFENAVELYGDYLSHTNLSVLFTRQKDYKKALEHAEKGYENYPEDETTKNNYGVALYNWAVCLSEKGKEEEAMGFFRKSAEFGNKYAKDALK